MNGQLSRGGFILRGALAGFVGGLAMPQTYYFALRAADWDVLLDTQPWACVINSADRRYRYAVCDRPMA
ncbi:MAG: hypothetical protein ABIZ57_06170 [Candidatus Limnocylindria bacterium]